MKYSDQVVDGYSYAVYESHSVTFEAVFSDTVAETLQVSSSDVSITSVTDGKSARKLDRVDHDNSPDFPWVEDEEVVSVPSPAPTSAPRIIVAYDVDIAGLTSFSNFNEAADSLHSQLSDAISDGSFDQALHQIGLKYKTTIFKDFSSSSLVVSFTDSSNSSSTTAPTVVPTMAPAELAGMTTFIFFMIVITFFVPYAAYVLARNNKHEKKPAEAQEEISRLLP